MLVTFPTIKFSTNVDHIVYSTCLHSEPPAASPIINKYSDSGSPVASTDGHLTVQEGINTRIRCRAEGGYPSVSSVSLGCGPLATTSVGNVAFLDVNVNRSRDASECSCTARHNSPCYRNNKTVLNLDVLCELAIRFCKFIVCFIHILMLCLCQSLLKGRHFVLSFYCSDVIKC
jgi:hypothetical protein